MSERMNPIPFPQLMDWLFTERDAHGAVFGVQKPFIKRGGKKLPLFRETIETPFGPAAGPNTQLAETSLPPTMRARVFSSSRPCRKWMARSLLPASTVPASLQKTRATTANGPQN